MSERNQRTINLALAGGGAHGAFTWGVLDRLIEDGRLDFEAVSATGSGAFVAAVMAQGWCNGGADGARQALDLFWERYCAFSVWSPMHAGILEKLAGSWNIDDTPGAVLFDFLTHTLGPREFNPLGLSPLKVALAGILDVERIKASPLKLFITATNVRTGKVKVFRRHELSLESFLAAACLPQVTPPVVIDGEPYWDGGMMGNPAIFPLIYGAHSPDVVIVALDPLTHDGLPTTPTQILDRLNEIVFNANLVRELRAVAFALKLIADESAAGRNIDRLKKMNVHMIADPENMRKLGFASKFNTDREFLLYLKALGRQAAGQWLDENFDKVGVTSSLDIATTFL